MHSSFCLWANTVYISLFCCFKVCCQQWCITSIKATWQDIKQPVSLAYGWRICCWVCTVIVSPYFASEVINRLDCSYSLVAHKVLGNPLTVIFHACSATKAHSIWMQPVQRLLWVFDLGLLLTWVRMQLWGHIALSWAIFACFGCN